LFREKKRKELQRFKRWLGFNGIYKNTQARIFVLFFFFLKIKIKNTGILIILIGFNEKL
jgi:hypothetical protein